MMEAGAMHAGGRERRPRPPVRGRAGHRCGGRRRARLAALAALVGLTPLTAVGDAPARAGSGCQIAPRGAQRTTEGLPKESGEASGFAASQRYPGALWMIRDSGHPPDLYALRFNPDGVATNRVMPVAGAANKDWEDLT